MASKGAQAGIRLLFDENLPWRVASALRELELRVSYVDDKHGSPPSPAQGSSDEVVLSHASRFNQTVVSSNHDMILLCVERGQQVIWIDPWGRHFRRAELALLVFKHIDDWAQRLKASSEPVCLRALRTKTETLQLDEAAHLVRKRMSSIARKRARSQQLRRQQELFPDA